MLRSECMGRFAFIAVAALTVAATGACAQSQRHYYSYEAPKSTYTAPSYGYGSNSSSHYVAPSLRLDGTYVQGHRRSDPNDTKLDNYSTKGNYNPYTGKYGTKNPY
jgi:hypothetical protein